MKNIFKKLGVGLALGASLVGFNSCKKDFLNQPPTTQVPTQDVFKTTQGARAALNGIHAQMYEVSSTDAFGMPSIGIMSDFMCGDMGMARQGSGWFVTAYYFYDRDPDGTGLYIWGYFFRMIHNANMIIANIDKATGDQGDKDDIKAQALFYRAFAYFQLANYYQFPYFDNQFKVEAPGSRTAVTQQGASVETALGLPIYNEPTQVPKKRSSLKETYQFITDNLDQAIALFGTSTYGRGSDKSQIDINVAKGLYARVALYMQDWDKAIINARDARQGYPLMDSIDIKGGFNRTLNREWIWGSEINAEANGIYASFLSHMSNEIEGAYAIGQERLISLMFFRQATGGLKALGERDYRRSWATLRSYVNSRGQEVFYAQGSKFKPQKPNSFLADYPHMRSAEMYLIEAEALAHNGSLTAAQALIEEYGRTRDPEYTYTGTSKDELVQEIWRQKRVELWGEGQGLFEARRRMTNFRTGGVTSATSINYNWGRFLLPGRGSVNSGSDLLVFRIPSSELEQNREMIQN